MSFHQQSTQKELDEQEQRLQKLRQLGEDLIEESDHDKETTKDIKAQLQDFDDCWNQVAKRVIDEKEKVSLDTTCTYCIQMRSHFKRSVISERHSKILEISKPVQN